MAFSIVSKDEKQMVLRFTGEIDLFAARDLKPQLNQLAEENPLNVVVDLTQAQYLDSSALGLLIGLRKRVLGHGKKLVVAVQGPGIRKLFELSDLDQMFTLVEGLSAAQEALGSAP